MESFFLKSLVYVGAKKENSERKCFWEEVFIGKLPREDTLKDNLSGYFQSMFQIPM